MYNLWQLLSFWIRYKGYWQSKEGNSESRSDLINEILFLTTHLVWLGMNIVLAWTPAQPEIPGNEMAEKEVKNASKNEEIDTKTPLSKQEFKSLV